MKLSHITATPIELEVCDDRAYQLMAGRGLARFVPGLLGAGCPLGSRKKDSTLWTDSTSEILASAE